ncbi:hypothetical protein EDC94DRAFT_586953 [Helicostylum pulchrum]|nr:hypothetical protein EDC94DRAFT_586953 [Helicostylum pulchrum]
MNSFEALNTTSSIPFCQISISTSFQLVIIFFGVIVMKSRHMIYYKIHLSSILKLLNVVKVIKYNLSVTNNHSCVTTIEISVNDKREFAIPFTWIYFTPKNKK